MSHNILVSVIVTTYNNHVTLDACLKSIVAQSYKPVELIVVDNHSSDDTLVIAKKYTQQVYTAGPERSAQRNFGVERAAGEWVLVIDSDMELAPNVITSCMQVVQSQPQLKALTIPEESFGEGFWARCKSLERSFYVGIDTIEALRFFNKYVYTQVGGYSVEMTGGEDWDLTRRIRAVAQTGAATAFIRHNEGRLYFLRTSRKMFYYGQHAVQYFAKNPTQSVLADQSGPLARYKLFFSRPGMLFKNPIVGLGMLLLKTMEFASGGLGYTIARLKKPQPVNNTEEI